jgi:hypothetical protein
MKKDENLPGIPSLPFFFLKKKAMGQEGIQENYGTLFLLGWIQGQYQKNVYRKIYTKRRIL